MKMALIFALASLVTGSASAPASGQRGADSDQAAIDALHQRDIRVTLSGDIEELVSLFADDGVLLSQDASPVVGKEALRERMKQDKARSDAAGMRVLKYAPVIRDLIIRNGVAYEWGQFEVVQQTGDGKRVEFHGKLLRILQRQPDGSWRFSRVMWNADGH